MDKAQSIQSFWSSFGIPAYDENSVPDDAVKPYITYNCSIDELGSVTTMYASLWYYSTNWVDIMAKTNEIEKKLSHGGVLIPIDGRGYTWIVKGHPFAQKMRDESDDMIRRVYINLQVEYLSN